MTKIDDLKIPDCSQSDAPESSEGDFVAIDAGWLRFSAHFTAILSCYSIPTVGAPLLRCLPRDMPSQMLPLRQFTPGGERIGQC
jgi:hypothetical protein